MLNLMILKKIYFLVKSIHYLVLLAFYHGLDLSQAMVMVPFFRNVIYHFTEQTRTYMSAMVCQEKMSAMVCKRCGVAEIELERERDKKQKKTTNWSARKVQAE